MISVRLVLNWIEAGDPSRPAFGRLFHAPSDRSIYHDMKRLIVMCFVSVKNMCITSQEINIFFSRTTYLSYMFIPHFSVDSHNLFQFYFLNIFMLWVVNDRLDVRLFFGLFCIVLGDIACSRISDWKFWVFLNMPQSMIWRSPTVLCRVTPSFIWI